jgi:hypothetical protein
MLRKLVATMALATLIFFPSEPVAATYKCDNPPSKEALIGVWAGNSVSITQNRSERTCQFSVNNAPVGSPPEAELLQAVNFFRARASGDSSALIRSVGFSLMAAAPVRDIPPDVLQRLEDNRIQLERCVTSFLRSGDGAPFESSGIRCRFIPMSNEPTQRQRSLEQFGAESNFNQVEISIEWDNDRMVSRLFLPFVAQPQLPLPPLLQR